MKKLALSLAVLAASGAYVWSQWGADPGDVLIGLSPADADAATVASAPPAPTLTQPDPAAIEPSTPFLASREPVNPPPFSAAIPAPKRPPVAAPIAAAPAPLVSDAAPAIIPDIPRPRPRPRIVREPKAMVVKASMMLAASGMTDGTFTGPAVDAYYGLVQIQAIVRGGRLVGVKVLQYPSDRRTSVAINRQALPMLRDEAVAAQSANVDIVSGATLTSEAFARSLKGALQRAMA